MAAGPGRAPARHELPEVDAAGLTAARWADRLLHAAREKGDARWEGFLAPLPERFRDESVTALRVTALKARAAYGPKDSIRDALPEDLVEPFRDALDRLMKAIARHEAER